MILEEYDFLVILFKLLVISSLENITLANPITIIKETRVDLKVLQQLKLNIPSGENE